jgi:hypothetical protein
MKYRASNCVGFIEPSHTQDTPTRDALTDYFAKLTTYQATYGTTGVYGNGSFRANIRTLGVHTCICGAPSLSYDFELVPGVYTNALLAHYLAWHRDAFSAAELARLEEIMRTHPLPEREVDDPAQFEALQEHWRAFITDLAQRCTEGETGAKALFASVVRAELANLATKCATGDDRRAVAHTSQRHARALAYIGSVERCTAEQAYAHADGAVHPKAVRDDAYGPTADVVYSNLRIYMSSIRVPGGP